ncbi:MAG: ribosome small subunit-dependent GTPase A [Bacillota bacterium]
MRGQVLGCYGDRVVVRSEEGEELICRLRGRLRREALGVVAGDLVRVGGSRAAPVVEEVLPRRNLMDRPPVANVDQVLVVFSYRDPPLDLGQVGRVLVGAEKAGVDAVAVVSKADLMGEEEREEVRELFRAVPYRLVVTSSVTAEGLEELRPFLRGRVSVLAGASGVGKSGLLNALKPGLGLATGEISPRIRRGRHTTRLARLLDVDGGTVADTPGFSRLDLGGVEPRELATLFPEMAPLAPRCRFADCYHRAEPGCEVRRAAEEGRVAPWRYRLYLELLSGIEEALPW